MEQRRFNPYKHFTGSFLPNWLLERTEISQGAKLAYARLAQYAGENGEAFPKQDTLGSELGVSERSARNYLKELAEAQLIESVRRGLGKTNSYFFLTHDWMKGGFRSVRKDVSGLGGRTVPASAAGSFPSAIERRESEEENQKKTVGAPAGADASPQLQLAGESRLTGAHIVEKWNSLIPKSWQHVRDIEGRAKKVAPRLKEPFWVQNWEAALVKAVKIPALRGGDWNKDRKWKPHFEWFVKPDTVAKILEGFYGTEPRQRQRGHKNRTTKLPNGETVSCQVEDDGTSEPLDVKGEVDKLMKKSFGVDRNAEKA